MIGLSHTSQATSGWTTWFWRPADDTSDGHVDSGWRNGDTRRERSPTISFCSCNRQTHQCIFNTNSYAALVSLVGVGTLLSAILSLHCTKLSSTVYCNRSYLRICLFVCLWVCYHDNSKLRASKLHQTWFVGKGSDLLRLVKFWRSCVPEGGLRRGDIFLAPPILQPARNVCVSLSVFYITAAVWICFSSSQPFKQPFRS